MITFDIEIDDFEQADIESLKLAKGILEEKIEVTPFTVAKFTYLYGYPEVEVFAHSFDEEDPFDDESEYEENIYYFIYETGDIIRVDYEVLEEMMKEAIKFELGRGLYISESEKEEYERLVEGFEVEEEFEEEEEEF